MPRRYVIPAVCLTLVLMCAALLFPAIQKVRATAALLTCQGRFKQLGLALHMYADANPREQEGKSPPAFPAGTLPNAELPPERRLSWMVSVVPYIEASNVFKQFDLARGPDDPKNEKATGNHFRMFVCAASDAGEYERRNDRWEQATPTTHYVGVAGVGADAATLPLGHPRAGVFGHDRRTAISDDFLDGASNTLLIIETANNPGHWAYGGPATVRAFEPGSAPYLGPDRPFGGFHNGPLVLFSERSHTCNAAMADGSVRSFTSATAPEVLEALATVGGKEELPANW